MPTSTITIAVDLDDKKVPEQISWQATDSTANTAQKAQAMMLAFWDGSEKTALRIDLWTKSMMVDDMADFLYQTISTMADSYHRATGHTELSGEMKSFAKDFYRKFREIQAKENKLST